MTARDEEDVQEPEETGDEERRAGQRRAWAKAISAENARQRTQRGRPSRSPFARIIPGVRRLPPERQP